MHIANNTSCSSALLNANRCKERIMYMYEYLVSVYPNLFSCSKLAFKLVPVSELDSLSALSHLFSHDEARI